MASSSGWLPTGSKTPAAAPSSPGPSLAMGTLRWGCPDVPGTSAQLANQRLAKGQRKQAPSYKPAGALESNSCVFKLQASICHFQLCGLGKFFNLSVPCFLLYNT